MKIFFIAPVFLFFLWIIHPGTMDGQNWKTSWGQQASCHPFSVMEMLYCDSHNNTYCGLGYTDSIFFPDTSFIHSSYMNYVIAKYDLFGKFVKAIDIYSDSTGEIYYVHCVADDDGNIYICAEFSVCAFLQDTVINTGQEEADPQIPDVFLAKLGPDFKIKWAKIISSPGQDDDWGFNLSADGHLYIACQHYVYPPSTKTLYLLGQDTIVFHKLLNTVTKTDLNGTIEWVQQITGKGNLGMFGESMQIGSDNNIYYSGSALDDIYVDGDTIFYPAGSHYYQSGIMVSFTPEGNLHSGQFEDLIWGDFKVNEYGEFYFEANVYDTMFVGQDTLLRTGDTILNVVGKADASYQPLWYHTIKKFDDYGYATCSIDIKYDSLYFTIAAERQMVFMDSVYDAGLYNKTFLCQLDPAGNLIHQQFFSSEFDLIPFGMVLDHCSNVVISGIFSGIAVFGRDTLVSYSSQVNDAFVGAIKRISNSIDIGPDTIVCDSITLHGPPGFAYYSWNDGLSNEPDFLVIQTGNYHLAVSTEDHCWMDDTIHVTVLMDQKIDLGNDTTIFRKDSLVLSLPSKYSSYEWSTGDTTASVILYGSFLGAGDHEIRVRVTEGLCSESDSMKVTVVNNPGISEEKDALFRIFPVPTSGSISIEIPVNNCELTILDAQGTEIYNRHYNNLAPVRLNLDLSGFKNGIYFIRINTGDMILMRKLVKI